MHLQDILPRDSFIAFPALRLAAPRTLWRNDAMPGSVQAEDFAFCMRYPEEPVSAYGLDEKLLSAERYGGPGLAGNSGGVRCGVLDHVQIKGTGRNCLAGVTTDYWHQHGAASVQDCIREAIWGEILHTALPYGAVRSFAVLSTGTQFDVEIADTGEPRTAPRGLLLREAALRPAHFMRSIFAAPSMDMASHPNDVQRTQAAVSAFESACAALKLNDVQDAADVNVMFAAIFDRAASQIAASRAKRIIHGSLTSSNFAVDGRWLDFGTVTALGDFGRAIVAPGSLDLWAQQDSVIDTINDLHFYLRKYLPPAVSRQLRSADHFSGRFLSQLSHALELEFLALSGIPKDLMNQAEPNARRRLWHAMLRLVGTGNAQPYLYFGDDRHRMPEQTGRYSLTRAMRLCAICASPARLASRLTVELGDPSLAQETAHAYWEIREAALSRCAGSSARTSALALALRGLRANWDLSFLYRRHFDGLVDDIRHDEENVGAFIDSMVRRGNAILCGDEDGFVPLSPWLISGDVSVSNELAFFAAGSRLPDTDCAALIGLSCLSDDEKSELARL